MGSINSINIEVADNGFVIQAYTNSKADYNGVTLISTTRAKAMKVIKALLTEAIQIKGEPSNGN